MIPVRLEDLHLTALNMSIRNIEIRLRTNKNMTWETMKDSERRWRQEQLNIKRKQFRRACKKYGRREEYEAYLEREAERYREEEILSAND